MVINLMNEKRLFDLREYSDLYQKDIAKEIGVTQQTYSLWEKGTKIIPLKHLNTLCNYYKVSMDYALSLTDERTYKNMKYLTTLNKEEIGKRIKKIREDHGMSYNDLAKELNTTKSTIYAYETGKTLILTAFAYQICVKYQVSLDWLTGKIK